MLSRGQLESLICSYDIFLADREIPIGEPFNKKLKFQGSDFHALASCRGTLAKIKELISGSEENLREEDFQRAIIWFGFVQGILYQTGCYSIEQLVDHTSD